MADIKIKRRILSACQTNCYYVFRDGSDEMVIIDPGDRGDIVYQDVKSLGCKKIAGILLTHGHGDHTGGALQLKELTGAKIYAYEEEAELLKDPEKNLSGWFGDLPMVGKQMSISGIIRNLIWLEYTSRCCIRRDIHRAVAAIMMKQIDAASVEIRFSMVL